MRSIRCINVTIIWLQVVVASLARSVLAHFIQKNIDFSSSFSLGSGLAQSSHELGMVKVHVMKKYCSNKKFK